jgi:hypothetical protein
VILASCHTLIITQSEQYVKSGLFPFLCKIRTVLIIEIEAVHKLIEFRYRLNLWCFYLQITGAEGFLKTIFGRIFGCAETRALRGDLYPGVEFCVAKLWK